MIDADAARREGFVPLGASRKGSSFRGGRAAANDTAAEIGSPGQGHFLQEQIVKGPAASLPRRKSLDERNEAKDQALYYSLRDRIPSDLAMTPGAGGQALRRVMLHGATVVFVTPGYEGKRFVFERAKDLGVRISGHRRAGVLGRAHGWRAGHREVHSVGFEPGLDVRIK